MNRKFAVMTALLLTCLMVSACGGDKETIHLHEHESMDLREKTASADILPKFLNNQSESVQLVYQLAAKGEDVLKWIPCYCGCGESAGHRSNYNCFINERKKDGSIIWDDHGTRCELCMQIAVEAVKMKQEGKTVKEIRQFIEAKYDNEDFAKPTNTPMPS